MPSAGISYAIETRSIAHRSNKRPIASRGSARCAAYRWASCIREKWPYAGHYRPSPGRHRLVARLRRLTRPDGVVLRPVQASWPDSATDESGRRPAPHPAPLALLVDLQRGRWHRICYNPNKRIALGSSDSDRVMLSESLCDANRNRMMIGLLTQLAPTLPPHRRLG